MRLLALTIALLNGHGQSAVGIEIDAGRPGTSVIRRSIAQVPIHWRCIKHLARILWNAARFIMMKIEGVEEEVVTAMKHPVVLSGLAGKWIMSRLAAVAGEMYTALEEYRFNDAASTIYQFIWH